MNMFRRFSSSTSRVTGFACIAFCVLVWTGWVISCSYSVRGTLTSYDITAIRFTVAGLILLPVLWRKGLAMGPWGWKGSFWLAAIMGAPYNTIAVFGMKYAPASHAAGIINTTVLTVTSVASIFLLREKTTRLRILGIFLSILGIGFILSAGQFSTGPDVVLGHALFLVGGVAWACYAISMRAWKVDPLHAASAVCGLSCLIYVPIYALFLPSHIGEGNWDEVAFQAVYQGIINSIFALLCYNRAVAILGAGISSAFIPLVPVLATLVAIPVLGEMPGCREWIGIAAAGIGVLLATGILASKPTTCTAPIDGAAAGN